VSRATEGFRAVRTRRHYVEHMRHHKEDASDLDFFAEREKKQREQIMSHAVQAAALRERVVALEDRIAALEAMYRSTEHATGNALIQSCEQEERLKDRIAALEAEVSRLSLHHPAPSPEPAGTFGGTR
jgi:BMFP domain-containing protein YqiC